MPIVAHRGFSAVAPENTLPAFARAVQAGADAIEFDIQESKEGVPFVFHDYELARTTNGTGRLRDHSANDLRTLDAGSWFSPEFQGERLVTLEEALAFLGATKLPLYPEMKAGLSRRAVEDVGRLLQRFEVAERSTVISFDWAALHYLREVNPEQHIGLLVHTDAEYDGAVQRAAEMGNAIVDCNFRLLLEDPQRVRFAHRHGIDLAVYTVNETQDAQRLLELGVDGITTNEVARLVDAGLGLKR